MCIRDRVIETVLGLGAAAQPSRPGPVVAGASLGVAGSSPRLRTPLGSQTSRACPRGQGMTSTACGRLQCGDG
eukprot:12178244-Alexandrium_andersonii.AAC.1